MLGFVHLPRRRSPWQFHADRWRVTMEYRSSKRFNLAFGRKIPIRHSRFASDAPDELIPLTIANFEPTVCLQFQKQLC